MDALGRAARASDPALRGPIRVSVTQIVATDLLMNDFVAFAKRWPEIDLQINATPQLADLDRREADIAIRSVPCGKRPADHLTGRRAGTYHLATYGEGDSWIGRHGGDADKAWIAASDYPELAGAGAIDSVVLQRAACAAGMGLTTLPCFFAEPMLKRRSEPEPCFDLWVLVHPDSRRSPRLKMFRDAIVSAIKSAAPRLEGR